MAADPRCDPAPPPTNRADNRPASARGRPAPPVNRKGRLGGPAPGAR